MIIATIVIICCMRKRKDNLKEMERRVQMNTSDTSRGVVEKEKKGKAKDKELEMDIELSEK